MQASLSESLMSAQTNAAGTDVDDSFTAPATTDQLQQVALALESNGFATEVARQRIRSLVPGGSTVLTAASETLRLSGIADDIDASGTAVSIRARVHSMNRQSEGDAI